MCLVGEEEEEEEDVLNVYVTGGEGGGKSYPSEGGRKVKTFC